MSSDDLLSAEIDDGAEIKEDYEDEEDKDAPREKTINLGYGKAETSTNNLLITSKNVFVPNAYDYLDANGKKVSAGYFSWSALNTYRRCQRSFYYKYVVKKRRPQAAPKMWGGSAIHEVVEKMLQAKIDNPAFMEAVRDTYVNAIVQAAGGNVSKFSLEKVAAVSGINLPFTNEAMKKEFKKAYHEFSSKYAQAQARAINEGKEPLGDVSWGARVESEQEFHVKYLNAIDGYIQKEYPLVKPKAIEELMIYHFPLDNGGTVPIVGFIDLIEETDFMSEYHREVTEAKDSDLDDYSKELADKAIRSIDNGEPMITDHKCGLAKSYESARVDQQLTLYSMAKGIEVVGFDSIALGTTGGKRPDRAKPAKIRKVFARRTQEDYEELSKDFNAIIKGISSGIYDKSGYGNSMVCSPKLCEFYSTECFKKGCK